MKKEIFFLSCILSASVAFWGCQREEAPLIIPEGDDVNSTIVQDESLLLEPEITELSEIHAQNVAKLFRQKSVDTKAGDVSIIAEDVTPILNAEATPLMYVVNFEDNGGFTIVSATKSYYPILAYSDDGYFDCSEVLPGGVDMWVADKKADIAYCKENESSIDVDFKAMWSEYEKQMEAPVTRVEIADVTAAFLATWVSNSYSISPLSAASALIPSSYYTSFTNQVSTYANPQYSTYAFVLYKNSYLEYTKGPLLNTTWHQGTHDNPTYNSLIPNQPVAGCVNIALAQIMYYHQYPSTYSWNAMLPNASTPAAQTLISNLYTATGGNGSATFNQAKNALSTFGYTYTEQNHTGLTTYICQSLNNNRPVFMTGFDSNGAGGHAWVCSGYKSTSTTREFYFAFVPNGPIQYDTFGPYSTTNTVHYFYHLWGWANTIVNGWFIEDHVNTTIDGESYNPTVDRKDLINITHN